jgi:hypothetical protein
MNLNNLNQPTLHLDPFKKDKVDSIYLYYSRKIFEKYYVWKGSIDFKNGNTSGKQEFEEKDLPVILQKMQQFLDSL